MRRQVLVFTIFLYVFSLQGQQANIDSLKTFGYEPSLSFPVTAASFTFEGDRIKALPFRGIQNYLLLNTDYIIQDGKAHLRGSRSDEIGYFLEGIDIRNPMTGAMYDLMIEEGLEKMEIRTGASGLDYGNAVAGIVTQRMRTGGDKFGIFLNYRGEPASAGSDLGGSNANGYSNTVLTLSGPAFNGKLRYFLSQEYHYEKDADPRFYEPFRYTDVPVDNEYISYFKENTDIIWDGDIAPRNSLERYKANASVEYNGNSWKIRTIGAFRYGKDYENPAPVFSIFNSRSGYTLEKNLLLGTEFSWTPVNNLTLTGNIAYTFLSSERFDNWADNSYFKWYDTGLLESHGAKLVNGVFSPNIMILGFQFDNFGKTAWDYYGKERNETYSGFIKAKYRINSNSEAEAGFRYQQSTLRKYYVSASAVRTSGETDGDFALQNDVNNFGYDVYGNDADDGYYSPFSPSIIDFFANYAYENEKFRLKGGIRYQSFNSDNYAYNDDFFYHAGNPSAEEDMSKAETIGKIGANLSLGLKLNEQNILFIEAGRNYQMNAGEYRYRGQYSIRRQINLGIDDNPVGFDYEPVKNDYFELGIISRLIPDVKGAASVYYNNYSGRSGTNRYISTSPIDPVITSPVLTNRVIGDSKGFSLKAEYVGIEGLYAAASYTYLDAEGNSSEPLDWLSSVNNAMPYPEASYPLDYAIKHRLNLLGIYRFQNSSGSVLNDLGITVNFRYSGGHPFTTIIYRPVSGIPFMEQSVAIEQPQYEKLYAGTINGEETQSTNQMDFRIDKGFSVGKFLHIKIFADIINLFNTKNELNVFKVSGQSDTDLFFYNTLNGNDASKDYLESLIARYGDLENMYNDINLRNYQAYNKVLGKEMLGIPRLFRLGIEFTY
jgi:hypothetical protein